MLLVEEYLLQALVRSATSKKSNALKNFDATVRIILNLELFVRTEQIHKFADVYRFSNSWNRVPIEKFR